jgi:hypothetical protein
MNHRKWVSYFCPVATRLQGYVACIRVSVTHRTALGISGASFEAFLANEVRIVGELLANMKLDWP